MSKKHFQLVAEALKALRNEGKNIQDGNEAAQFLLGYFSAAFIRENPKFDKTKFEKATR